MRPSRRVVGACVVLATLWLVAFFLVLPALVSDAYAGQSFVPWFNRAISGQSQHPLSHYQALARRAALMATAGALVMLVATGLAWYWRAQLVAALKRLVKGAPTIGFADVLVLGAWFGYVNGLVEVISLFIRFAGDPPAGLALHRLWMSPLATACLGAIVAVLFGLVVRAWRGVNIGLPVLLFTALTVYSVAFTLRLGLHPAAIAVLSLGIGIQLRRVATGRATAFMAGQRRVLAAMAGSIVVGAIVIASIDPIRERMGRRLRGTPGDSVPNVLFLILDTVRAQDLGLYGYPRATSPEMERLASTGVTFDHAIVTAPWTLPSHASMFTGLPPDRLSTDFHEPLDAAAPTLAEVLRARGYETGGFVANAAYGTRVSGLDRGFTVYRDLRVTWGQFLNSSFWVRLGTMAIRDLFEVHGALIRKEADQVNDEFLSWMPTDGTPFFAFLNYIDAHTPYTLHPPFDRMFRDPPPRFWIYSGWDGSYTESERQEFQDAYNSTIAYIDAQVGSLLRELDRRGVLRNTLVVLTADHGEHMGEHGIFRHANSLYLPLLHVPLVISYPSRIPAGVRVRGAVSTQDIPATILDVLGHSGSPPLPGRSLSAYWRTAVEGIGLADTTVAAYSELTPADFTMPNDPIRHGEMRSLVRGRLHYIRNGKGVEELYDYLADPGELVNRAIGADSASLLAPFRALLTERGPSVRTKR